MIACDWKPLAKNTLRGFFSLSLQSGLIIKGCSYHVQGDNRWISVPAKSYQKDGAASWVPVIEFASAEARKRFQSEALEAVDRLLGAA